MNLASRTETIPYNLVTNNCTTFVVSAAELGGIKIDGHGFFPILGGSHGWLKYGANPASLGQDILEGAYSTTDGVGVSKRITNRPEKEHYYPYY